MRIDYILGTYILTDRKHGYYFSGRTRREVIDKAFNILTGLVK